MKGKMRVPKAMPEDALAGVLPIWLQIGVIPILPDVRDGHDWTTGKFVRTLPDRKTRPDFAWLEWKVTIEVEGAVYVGGRHTRGAGYTADCAKYNEYAVAGWWVLRFTPAQLESGEAMDVVGRLFARLREERP